jgi:hypothetical protein
MGVRAVKVGRPAWKADRGSSTMGIVLPCSRHLQTNRIGVYL